VCRQKLVIQSSGPFSFSAKNEIFTSVLLAQNDSMTGTHLHAVCAL